MSRWLILTAASLTLASLGCDPDARTKPSDTSTGTSPQSTSETSSEAAPEAPDEVIDLLSPAPERALPEGATPGGTLRMALGRAQMRFPWRMDHPDTLNMMSTLVQEPLGRQDLEDPTRVVPALAERITLSKDRRTYTITLREGARWHPLAHPKRAEPGFEWMTEPHDVTAEDIVFTVSLHFRKGLYDSGIRTGFEGMEGIEKIDDRTVEITWRQADSRAAAYITGMRLQPAWVYTRAEDGTEIPPQFLAEAYERHWARAFPVGAGPYRVVKSSAVRSISLERFEEYYGARPLIERIEIVDVPDAAERLALLKRGEVDVTDLPPEVAARATLDAGVAGVARSLFNYSYIAWNTRRPPFDDPRVRRAMSMAVDRGAPMAEAFESSAVSVSGPLLPGHPALDPGVALLPFDLEGARALLEESGWVDTDGDGTRDKEIAGERVELAFELRAFDRPDWAKFLAAYVEDLGEIGVSATIVPSRNPVRDASVFQLDFDAFVGGWGTGWATDPYTTWHSANAGERGSNPSGFVDARADALTYGLRTLDPAFDPMESLRELHAILAREQPFTFLFAPQRQIVYDTARVQGVEPSLVSPGIWPATWYIPEGAREPAPTP